MRIVMVKKRLRDGQPCRKCVQAEQLLRDRGLESRIDAVVWADEANEHSEGVVLAKEFGVDTAPFFLVYDNARSPQVYTSALRLIREQLRTTTPQSQTVEPPSAEELSSLQERLRRESPAAAVDWALSRYGRSCAIAFSGGKTS